MATVKTFIGNIKGPAGAAGETGPAGPQGIQGERGEQGIQGIQGPAGETGPQGPQGIQGEQGPVGPRGPAGETGPAGPQGIQGEKGATGSQGPAGSTGPQGPAGPAGADGVGIKSAVLNSDYTLTLTFDDGTKYTTPSLRGPQGPAGSAGATGPAGSNGVSVTHKWSGTTLQVTSASGTSSADLKGDKGDTGSTGPAGSNGVSATHSWNGTKLTITSASGTSSADLKGATGGTGPQGPAGAAGADAKINGYNTITLSAGTGISLTQSGSTFTIASTASGGVKVVQGTYTGTGTSGSSNKKTLTFPGAPQLVIIMMNGSTSVSGVNATFTPHLILVRGSTYSQATIHGISYPASTRSNTVGWTDTSVSWYHHDTSTKGHLVQMNESGKTYSYVAIYN